MDGLASKDLIPTITKCINEVVGEVSSVTAGEGKTGRWGCHGPPRILSIVHLALLTRAGP